MRRAAWPGLLLLLATAASAEVRVRLTPAGPTLSVRETPSGVWSTVGARDRAGVLNPSGDLTGDGHPTSARAGRGMLVAWSRPSAQSLMLAEVQADGSSRQSAARVGVITGTPVVIPAGESWLVIWQSAGDSPAVHAGIYSRGSLREVAPLHEGRLLATVPYEGGVAVVGLDPVAGQLIISAVILGPVNPRPVPDDVLRVALTRIALRKGDASGDAEPVTCSGSDGDEALIAWDDGPRTIGFVRVGAWGIEGPEVIDGPNGSCEALLRAVGR